MNTRISSVRRDLALTQTEFGEAIGATRAMIASYESGKVVPDKTTRILICEKFHVNQTWLETGEGEPYKTGSTYDILRALDAMPALRRAFEAAMPRLTLQDMQTINALLEKFQQVQE